MRKRSPRESACQIEWFLIDWKCRNGKTMTMEDPHLLIYHIKYDSACVRLRYFGFWTLPARLIAAGNICTAMALCMSEGNGLGQPSNLGYAGAYKRSRSGVFFLFQKTARDWTHQQVSHDAVY